MSLNKKRATIVTLYDQKNYGNRLQNYAVQNVLEMLGIEVETLSYVKKIFDLKFYMMFIFHKLTRYHFSKDPFFGKKDITILKILLNLIMNLYQQNG